MKKRVISILLICIMVLSAVGCGQKNEQSSSQKSSAENTSDVSSVQQSTEIEEESPYPEYLNLDTYFPLVKEGEKVTLNILLVEDFESDAEDRFFFKMIEDKMNVNLEIQEIS